MNQLFGPVDIILDKENNSLIISEWINRRVMRWSLETDAKHGYSSHYLILIVMV